MPDKKTGAKVNMVEQPNKNGRSRRANREDLEKRRLRVRTAITTVYNKPIYRILSKIKNEPSVQWPAKLGVTQRVYDERSCCTFHDEKGHLTENCTPLRQHLEELVVAGHLDQYIEGGTQPAPQDLNAPNGIPVDGPPQGVINVIHGIIEPERVCELRGMIKKAEHLKEILGAQSAIKKGKTKATNVISFSDKDLARLHCPYNDALVVNLRVKNFEVKRILIDQGSLCEIMYYETFKQLKLEDKDLAPATSPLVGFNSMLEWPISKIILTVKAGTMTKQVEFWCFVTVNGSRAAKGYVQIVEEPERNEQFANVGKAAEQKAVEDLVEVKVDEKDIEKFFLLGSSLSNTERTELMEFLISNIEVFAWMPYNMPGIDQSSSATNLMST
ncbi:uncharacterized protein LOC114290870 [Camellia sinensis]|uniref:uncharacterized protein LOC114290870 n=1 Tax=Camellia sinensis TaxID=4442 RepID=UPI0010361B3A|nr:uncharacterized protein LOC114290870 [Camellia sinensis]